VNLFFALSGFLIARSVMSPAVFDVRAYAVSRVRRIVPAYGASLLLLLAVTNTRYLVTPGWPVDLGVHLALLHAWVGGGVMASINPVYWSLSHEWTFYGVMALAAAGVRRARLAWPVVAGLVLVAVLSRWGWVTGRWGLPNGHLHPLAVADQFAFGILAAGICRQGTGGGRILGKVAVAVGMLVGVWAIWQYQEMLATGRSDVAFGSDKWSEAARKACRRAKSTCLFAPVLVSFGFGCLLTVGWRSGGALSRWLRFTPLPWMGKVSYSTYLWHFPIIGCLGALQQRAVKTPGLDRWLDAPGTFILVAFILVYLVSWISYRGFEEPYVAKARP